MRTIAPFLTALLLPLALAADKPTSRPAVPPAVGDVAPDFTLDTIDGKPVDLAELRKAGPVVVLQLRGWVGYQCPICTRQVGAFIGRANDFAKGHATIVMVYPGPAEGLQAHADDFVAGKTLPANVRLVLDPDLKMVHAWHLRWAKPGETAYPATFAVDPAGVVRFAKVSHSHGNRAAPQDVLAAMGHG